MNPHEEIANIKDGEKWIWPDFDYGRAEIWRINNMLFLFEIPLYGGYPIFDSAWKKDDIDRICTIVNSWT